MHLDEQEVLQVLRILYVYEGNIGVLSWHAIGLSS